MISLIVVNIVPLYALIALGFVAGKYLDVNLHSISRVLIFILLPFVIFGAVMKMDFNPAYILLPFLISFLSYIIALSAKFFAGKIWSDGTENLIAVGGVNGNAIYFGLSIIMALFGPLNAAIYLFMNLGGTINNVTLGYYLSARGRHDVLQSAKRVVKFPAMHMTLLAILLNIAGVEVPDVVDRYWNYSAGAMVILGMMMIGISVAKLKTLSIDLAQIGAFFAVKFIAWPLAMIGFIVLDRAVFGLYGDNIHQMMVIFSVMPLMGNLVAYAAEHNLHPERAGAAVIASSLFALVAIPLAAWLMPLLIG